MNRTISSAAPVGVLIGGLALAGAALYGPGAHAGVINLSGTFLGYDFPTDPDPDGPNYSSLSGNWSARVDTSAMAADYTGYLSAGPDSFAINHNPFTPFPDRPNFFKTLWETGNVGVDVQFSNGVPTGVVRVGGAVDGNASQFSSSFNDFELFYNDGFVNLAEEEPLTHLFYSLIRDATSVAPRDFNAGSLGGVVNLSETTLSTATDPVVNALGGAARGGVSLEFTGHTEVEVTVDPAPAFVSSLPQVVLGTGGGFQAWDIEVNGSYQGDVRIQLPVETGLDPNDFYVYHFDEQVGLWELLETEVVNGQLFAFTDNFSPTFQSPNSDLLGQLNGSVPEPGTLALVAAGLGGIGVRRRARRRAR